jgi:N,N'-diacetyllegionaminate synthase
MNMGQDLKLEIDLQTIKTKAKKVFIIAEAGVNHNGSIDLAKKLIDVASNAGADAVKFQTFKADSLVSKDAKKAKYQAKNMDDGDNSQYNMLKKLELDIDTHKELISYSNTKNIMFLSTPFDLESIKLLHDLNLQIFKIPSGEITNLPYLREIGKLKKQVILSTGMSTMQEIKDALEILLQAGTKKENITILHANTMYPTPLEDVNLNAMLNIGKTFDIAYGYSDHTLGIEIPTASVAMGASVIEKHFTLDKTMQGPDHKASLEPQELKAMVKAIRNIELALGDGIKKPSKSEIPNIEIVRKSIVAKITIKKGDIFTKDNLSIKRPAGGINPMKWDEIIGSIAKKDYKEDELI